MEKLLGKKDYSKLTVEELMSEEKKTKSLQIPTALLIGFLIGVAVWSATHKWGFLITIMLMGIAFLIGKWSSQTIKDIKNEINRRNLG
jgi:uncharacterized membrane protein YbjE (DUF340 family)